MQLNSVGSIEDLPDNVFYSINYDFLNTNEISIFNNCIQKCHELANSFAEEYINSHNLTTEASRFNHDICGFADVVSYDIENKYCRYALKTGHAYSIGDKILFNNLKKAVPSIQSITYHEYISQKQSEIMTKELGVMFYVHSVRD